MLFPTYFRFNRNHLETIMLKLIKDDIINDILIEDIQQISWIRLFYIVLRHSTDYLNIVDGRLQQTDINESTFNDLLLKFQLMTEHCHRHPPYNIHINLIDKLIHFAEQVGNATLMSNDEIRDQLNRYLHEYLRSLARMINDNIVYNDNLQEFFSIKNKFYLSDDDSDTESMDLRYREEILYSERLNRFLHTIRNGKLMPQALGYIFYSVPETAAIYTFSDIPIPIVGNFFPSSFKKLAESFDPFVFNRQDPLDHSITNIQVCQNYQDQQRNDFVFNNLDKVKFERIDTNQNGFRDYLSDKLRFTMIGTFIEPIYAEEDSGKSETSLSSASTQSFKSFSSLILNDTDYIPDYALVYKARHEITLLQALDSFPKHLYHINRFNVETEEPILVLHNQVRDEDLKVNKGKRPYDGYLIITFTKMSRKPIFNPVI